MDDRLMEFAPFTADQFTAALNANPLARIIHEGS